MTDRETYIAELREQMKSSHLGLFITGPGQLDLLEEPLPESCFDGDHVISRSLGNCRCTSDSKAIKQFTAHTRVPDAGTPVALGHECIQVIVDAPAGSGLTPGDLVFITPGHATFKIDTETFEPDEDHGTLPSLGYTYRKAGGLRQFSALPQKAMAVVDEQGFGPLYNRIPYSRNSSLASLAHAEAFACCYGSNLPLYTFDDNGDFVMGIPPKAKLALLGGTARMGLINLSIISAMPHDELPTHISLTGSASKLGQLRELPLIKRFAELGVHVELIDRNDPDIVAKLVQHGRPDIIWTNYDSQEVYDQASEIIAPGGNINNYAGARDPEIGFNMEITPAPTLSPADWLQQVHHGVGAIEYQRRFGIREGGILAITDIADGERLRNWLAALPKGHKVVLIDCADVSADFPQLQFLPDEGEFDDVFIAGMGEQAAKRYAAIELRLKRGAAVAFIDGDCEIRIRARNAHYQSVHQLCGPNVPWYMTNTSIPTATDMRIQGTEPIDFDWMVVGVAGLAHTQELYEDVIARAPMGSFFTLVEIPDFPYVEVGAAAFRAKAAEADGQPKAALEAAAQVMDGNGDQWSRAVEASIYQAYGKPYPLDL